MKGIVNKRPTTFSLSEEKNRNALLDLYAECGNMAHTCREFRIDVRRVADQAERMPEFGVMVKAAKKASLAVLELEARRRAVEGVEQENYDRDGNLVSVTTKFSDTLLIFLMKAGDPKKYRDNFSIEHKGSVQHNHDHVLRPVSESVAFLDDALGGGKIIDVPGSSTH